MIQLLAVIALAGLLESAGPSLPPVPRNDALRARLLAMARDDQSTIDTARSGEVHARNSALIREIVGRYGWPGKSLAGPDGAHAAWLVVQHEDQDVEFQEQCLGLMRLAFQQDEVSASDLAFLADRVLTHRGKPQMYGTQGGGVTSPEDEARIDANRFALGLEPWREFVKKRRENYGPWIP